VSLRRARVVLVRPHVAANIGAVARLMRNFGLSDLVVVDPLADPLDAEARKLSTHGEPILHAARHARDLADALDGCVWVVATAARTGGLFRGHAGPPERVMPVAAGWLAAGPVAVVFGPEPSGLTTDEVSRCHALVHIPAEDDYPALNLAQAAAVTLYHLRAGWREREGTPAPDAPATFAEQEMAFERLREALERVHFLYGDKADALMHALRQLLSRAGPTPREVKLLLGLARQLVWFAEHRDAPDDDAVT
jgi:tRNA/rRNA methyltransferase